MREWWRERERDSGEVDRDTDRFDSLFSPLVHQKQCPVQDIQIEISDFSAFFQLSYKEMIRCNDSPVFVYAADQRLRSDQFAGNHIDFRMKVDGKSSGSHGLSDTSAAGLEADGNTFAGGIISGCSGAHDTARFIDQRPAVKRTVGPGISDAQTFRIAAPDRGAQTDAAPCEYLTRGVRTEDHKFGIPCAEQKGIAEDVSERL